MGRFFNATYLKYLSFVIVGLLLEVAHAFLGWWYDFNGHCFHATSCLGVYFYVLDGWCLFVVFVYNLINSFEIHVGIYLEFGVVTLLLLCLYSFIVFI